MQKAVKKIIKELAAKHQIPEAELEKIFTTQFQLVKDTAESADRNNPDTFKTVQIMKLGKFYVKESVKKAYIEKKANQLKQQNND